MKLRHLAATAALTAGTLAGCSDPNHPSRNPHPTQRYEVTITTDAPGAWDSVRASVRYEVGNLECLPEASVFIGGHISGPMAQWDDIEIVRVGENTWRGYFFRDLLHDEDYYGLGVCHWDGSQIASISMVHGARFISSGLVNSALQRPLARFFRKSDFQNRFLDPDAVRDFDEADADLRRRDDFFRIAVTVKEVKP